MARYNYQEIIEELASKVKISKNDTFDFEDSPIKPIFASYFQFCQENLAERCGRFDIQPARFYFTTEFSVNASAGRTPGENPYYIVRVNMGTIMKLYNLFYEQNDLFEKDIELSHYNSLNETLDIPLGLLMFQLATLFTYYHELTHLIQKSPLLNLWLNEAYTPANDNYSADKHVLELDADLNAAHSICFHILEFWRKQNIEFQTQETLEKMLSIGTASILSYFLFLSSANKEMYYKAYAHPHIFIRLAYIIDCFISVAEVNLRPDKNEKLNASYIVKEGFNIADRFFKLVLGENRVETFSDQYFKEMQNIKNYANELLNQSKGNPALYMNRYKD